jgi:hypothetical protein
MDLNDKQFRQYYVSRGVKPGAPVSRRQLESLYAEYLGQSQADAEQAQALLDPLPEVQPAPAPDPQVQPRQTDVGLDLVSPARGVDFDSLPPVQPRPVQQQEPEYLEVSVDSPEYAAELVRTELMSPGMARKRHLQETGADALLGEFQATRGQYKTRTDYDEAKARFIRENVPGIGVLDEVESRARLIGDYRQAVKEKDPALIVTYDKLARENPLADPAQLFERVLSPRQTIGSGSPELAQQIEPLVSLRDKEIAAAETAPDDEARARHLERAYNFDLQIDTTMGVRDKPFGAKEAELEIAKNDLKNLELRKDGFVKYRGRNWGYEEIDGLRAEIQKRDATLDLEAMKRVGDLPINRLNTTVVKEDVGTGQRVIDEQKTNEKFAQMAVRLEKEGKLRPGITRIQDPYSGSIVRYGGLETFTPKEDKSLSDRVTPKKLKPALEGAGVVAEGITAGVSRLAPRVASTAGETLSVMDAATGGPQTRNALSRLPTAFRGGNPSMMLAQQGLRYLSEIGLKKQQEEEQKKLAGQ